MKNIAPLMRKKWLLAVIAAAVVGSGAYAFAATLGVNSQSLGAGNATVSACADHVNASYTTAYDATIAGHTKVSAITLQIPGAAVACVENTILSANLEGPTTDPDDSSATNLPAVVTHTLSSTEVPNGTDPVSLTLTLTTAVPAKDISGIAVSAVGPAPTS